MRKDLNVLFIKDQIKKGISGLDKDKIHILYFSYYLNRHNLYHNPLLLSTKLLNFIKGTPSIDHVNHISRFRFDELTKGWEAEVFEATMELGMESNDLFDKLKAFQGVCYIETLDKKVDRRKAKAFQNKYYGVPYSKSMAVESGIDIKFLEKKGSPKNNGGFCSWLESLFLVDQGVDISKIEKGNPLEITPTDLFVADLGERKILFKY